MKALTKISIGFLALVAVALWFTSCSSEDVTSGTNQGKMSSLTLSINTGKSMGSRATNWTDDPGTDKAQTENKINRLTVGIFSSDGNTVKTIVELTSGQSKGNTLSAGGTTAKIVTTSLAANDKVLVAVNAPTGKFAGVANVTAFKAVEEDAKDALTDGSSEATEIATNVPMFGESTLSGTGSDFTANVTVQHQLAKITLDVLEVAFDKNGPYKDAEFTPTGFFLVNVPDKLAFNSNAWVNGASHLHGMNAATYHSLTASTKWGTYKEYLSSAATGSTPLNGTSAKYDSKSYFYVTPSDDNTDDGKMKLIIAGTFKTNSSDAGTTVFYPVALNANYDVNGTPSAATEGTDVFKVYPNKNYKCKVVIKKNGTKNPTEKLEPQTATVTVTVSNFEDASQTTTFE